MVALWDATAVLEEIDLALARGFVTPLEADQAHDRILVTDSVTELAACGLVFVPDEATANQLRDVLRPRCLVACLDDSSAALLNGVSDGHAILSAWLTPFGVTVHQPEVAHSIRRAA